MEHGADIVHILPFKIALIAGLGIGAQWLAWRLQWPAIVLMSIAGLAFGPALGYLLGLHPPEFIYSIMHTLHLDPVHDFGDLLRPMVAIAVAIILFEGGLTLKFSDLRDAQTAVGRMVFIAGPIAWVLGASAAHYVAGLPWDIAALIGGLLVVTGPTVILPLLRQAHLAGRPASVLKWESIVNDPIGALFAVIAYEFIRLSMLGEGWVFALGMLIFAVIIGTVMGFGGGKAMAWAFRRGYIPEYLKAPIVLAFVLLIFVIDNMLAEETGLLAVTIFGITLANTKLASLSEMRRFKENIAVILVSGVFVVLTATLTPEVLAKFDLRIIGFVLVMMFFVRPIAVSIATLFSGLNWKEVLLISWIAPRGIVAVAVAGFFATELVADGRADGAQLIPIAFAMVFATVLSSGFTIGPLSKLLGLSKGGEKDGVLLVGANPWTLGLAKTLKAEGVPVTIADTNWRRLRAARLDGYDVFYGEVLSEQADHRLDHAKFTHLIAATQNDAYNALVCVEFAPELGRHRVFQFSGQDKDEDDPRAIVYSSRGRTFGDKGRSFDAMVRDWWNGWRFRAATLSSEYSLDKLMESRGSDVDTLLEIRADGTIDIMRPGHEFRAQDGSTIITFGPAREEQDPRLSVATDPAAKPA